jgi:hypothetical protein
VNPCSRHLASQGEPRHGWDRIFSIFFKGDKTRQPLTINYFISLEPVTFETKLLFSLQLLAPNVLSSNPASPPLSIQRQAQPAQPSSRLSPTPFASLNAVGSEEALSAGVKAIISRPSCLDKTISLA